MTGVCCVCDAVLKSLLSLVMHARLTEFSSLCTCICCYHRPVPTFSRRSSVSIAALEGKESLAAVSESPVLTKKSSFAARSPSESPSLTKKPSFALQSTIAETSPASAAAAPGSPSQRRMSVQTHSAAPGLSKQPSFVLQSTIAESPTAAAASPSSRRMSVRTGSHVGMCLYPEFPEAKQPSTALVMPCRQQQRHEQAQPCHYQYSA